MKGLPTGTYLIRKAESAPGNFSLSVRDGDSVKHYRIRKLDTGGYFITSRAPFSSLHELVQHYSKDADGLVCALSVACPNETSYRWFGKRCLGNPKRIITVNTKTWSWSIRRSMGWSME